MAVASHCPNMPGVMDIVDTARLQQKSLAKEVRKYCEDRGAKVAVVDQEKP